MMYMWFWFGYDLGDFLFSGLEIVTRWAFALTWIVLFFVALLFEASKVYLARVQREAHKQLHPHRSDERRNLLCDSLQIGRGLKRAADDTIQNAEKRRWLTPSEPSTSQAVEMTECEVCKIPVKKREAGGNMAATTSRNTSTGQVSRWASLRVRMLVNFHQSVVFVVHNVVGYLLMLAVMVYNVHLLLAVVFGMMLGYFLFGPKLTRLQMECFGRKRLVICTPECDDTAENTNPPLLDSALNSESDFFICQTRTCIQPSHYFRASTSQGPSELANATCYYGAKSCPSRVARAKRMQQAHCHHTEEKEDSPSVEDVQLLSTEGQGCCKKEQPPECCKSSQEALVEESCCKRTEKREESPQITCCHTKTAPSESQEQIVK